MPTRTSAPAALVVLALLAGCGGSSPKPDPAREGRVVAELNAFCRSVAAHGSRPQTEAQIEAVQARAAALTKQLSQAAAYLPAGKAFNEARAKRKVLEHELAQHSQHTDVRVKGDPIERFYRLELQIYNARTALGLTDCRGRPPRAPISG